MSNRQDNNPSLAQRRQFLKNALTAGVFFSLPSSLAFPKENKIEHQLFENGDRELVTYPGKNPLLLITARPPHLETPFEVFNNGILTANENFFVRYHLANIPLSVNLNEYKLTVTGKVKKTLTLSLDQLKKLGEHSEVVAVNQCAGNGRGFVKPRVFGAQLGNGSMGNARWRGIPLKTVLEQAGVEANAKQVLFKGLDRPVLDETPHFIKALDIEHALSPEPLLAWSMNDKDIPLLNGYPLKLIVPGYFGTYWVKHLSEITLVDKTFDGFFMATAYRVPDTPSNGILPGTLPSKTIPITQLKVRSFITSLRDHEKIKVGHNIIVKGIAFDGGTGIKKVLFSENNGQRWKETKLSNDLGKFSFREWSVVFTPQRKGIYDLKVKATNNVDQEQPVDAIWNPAGYLKNNIEIVRILSV